MNIVIRADASAQIGTGHIMRCLALAQAWQQEGGKTVFVLADKSPALEARLQLEGMKVVYLSVEPGSNEDALQTADISQQLAARWIIVDGYHFGAKYQKNLKESGANVLFIDDYGHAEHYYADLVLNQNVSAHEDLYKNREPYTKLLLGTQYVLLRREFWQWRGWHRTVAPVARKILITLGGSDPNNVTLKVIQALQQINLEDLEIVVIVGGSNPHYEQLEAEVKASNLSISLQRNVINMPELMAWADLAVAAGGSTNWELAFMGLPSLIISVANNQKVISAELDYQGIVSHLGWHQQVTSYEIGQAVYKIIGNQIRRKNTSQRGQKLVDKNGGKRVISKMFV